MRFLPVVSVTVCSLPWQAMLQTSQTGPCQIQGTHSQSHNFQPDVEHPPHLVPTQVRQQLSRSLSNAGTKNGSSASTVTTQGLTLVAKFLALNGPSGTISHACTSRADQSLSSTTPNSRDGPRPRPRPARRARWAGPRSSRARARSRAGGTARGRPAPSLSSASAQRRAR